MDPYISYAGKHVSGSRYGPGPARARPAASPSVAANVHGTPPQIRDSLGKIRLATRRTLHAVSISSGIGPFGRIIQTMRGIRRYIEGSNSGIIPTVSFG